jgi:hypothetical protein
MNRTRGAEDALRGDGHSWRVIDDIAHDHPVTSSELDAVEAFLMPLLKALLADAPDIQSGKTNPNTALMSSPTQKRRNELLPEEI